jgi:hypothetical protein
MNGSGRSFHNWRAANTLESGAPPSFFGQCFSPDCVPFFGLHGMKINYEQGT